MNTMEVKIAYTFVTPFCGRYEYMEDYLTVASAKELASTLTDAFKRRSGISDVAVVAMVPGNTRGIMVHPSFTDSDVFTVETYNGVEHIGKRKVAAFVWDYVASKANAVA